MKNPMFYFGFILVRLCLLVACGDDSKDDPNLPVTMVDQMVEAGWYRVCWDQLDRSGERVPDHYYSVLVETASGFDTAMFFSISARAAHVVSPGCDSLGFKGGIPDAFGARLNSSTYAPADTVVIDFDLPVADSVVIRVFWLGDI